MDQTPSFEQWVTAHERSLLRIAWLLSGNAATSAARLREAVLPLATPLGQRQVLDAGFVPARVVPGTRS